MIKNIKFEENHIHTTFSDGVNTVEEILEYNQTHNCLDLAFTDHVDKKTKWFNKYYSKINKLRKKYDFNVYIGCEVKILDDGSLNTTKDILGKSEFTIASVHFFENYDSNRMRELSFKEMLKTEVELIHKLTKHFDYLYVDVLGHPFGMTLKFHPFKEIPLKYIKEIYNLYETYSTLFEANSRYLCLNLMKFIKTKIKHGKHNFSFGSDVHDIHELTNIDYDILGYSSTLYRGHVNVLVTAVGGGVGQGILKSLTNSNNQDKYVIHTADSNPNSAGFFFQDVHHTVVLPLASDEKKYVTQLTKYIKKHKIDVVLIGSDCELEILSKIKDDVYDKFKCTIIVSNSTNIDISRDKNLTRLFCNANHIKQPSKYGFPLVVKPVFGSSSKDVFVCDTLKQSWLIKEYLTSKNIPYLTQKHIKGREITCCVVYVDKHLKGVICMEREIYKGVSYRTKIIRDERVIDFIYDIAEKYEFEGPCNFQVIDDGKDIYLIEINCRFSGTTGLRNSCGFNSIDQLIDYYVYGKDINIARLNSYKDKQFLRYWDEVEK